MEMTEGANSNEPTIGEQENLSPAVNGKNTATSKTTVAVLDKPDMAGKPIIVNAKKLHATADIGCEDNELGERRGITAPGQEQMVNRVKRVATEVVKEDKTEKLP